SRGAGVLFDLIIGAVGEAHDHLLEVLHKLRVLAEKFQAGTLGRERWFDGESSIPDEHRTRNFPGHRGQKTNRSREQMKRPGVTLQGDILDLNCLTQSYVPQLLISRVRVRRRSLLRIGGRGK